MPEFNPAYSFDDCVGSWAQPYLETARKHHIISGIGDNLFDPERPITREEIAVMMNNVTAYKNAEAGKIFTDVSKTKNPWSYSSIEAITSSGVMTGYPDGTYNPAGGVTRAEMTVYIAKMAAV
jgi:hypothetical protein